MIKRDAYTLLQLLTMYYETKMPPKFALFTMQNKLTIEKDLKKLIDIMKPSKQFLLYEQGRITLLKKYCEKDINGNPIIRNNIYVVKKNKEKLEKELEELKSKYDDIDNILKESKEKNGIADKILNEETEIELAKIKLSEIPDRLLSPRDMELFNKLEIIDYDI